VASAGFILTIRTRTAEIAHRICMMSAYEMWLQRTIAVSLISFVIKLGLVPYALPAMMPTWRWWLGAALAGGGLLSALWIEDTTARSRPDSNGGPGDVLGALMGLIITISFVTGVVVRAYTLMMSARGIRPAHGIAVTIAGFGFMVAILVLPILL
jgi:hypothetical protein